MMKKKISLLVASLALVGSVTQAQWGKSGTTVSVNDTLAKVSIGTKTNNADLHVQKNGATTMLLKSKTAGATLSIDRGNSTGSGIINYKNKGKAMWSAGLNGDGNYSILNSAYNKVMFSLDTNGTIHTNSLKNAGYVDLNPFDGGIEIGSGDDEYASIDFKGNTQLQSDYGARILYRALSDKMDIYGIGTCIFRGNNSGNLEMKLDDGGIELVSGNDGKAFIDFKGNGQLGLDYGGRIIYDEQTDVIQVNGAAAFGVCGLVKAKEVLVQTGWCDYVFKDDYKLRPLEEVATYIKENNHLPEVTPGPEIEANGLEVGKVSSEMIKKIEELTLYMIQMNDKMKEKDAQVLELKHQIELLNSLKK